jgi:hypothetical protein
MIPRVVDAYTQAGYVFEMGSPGVLWTGVTPRQDWRPRRMHQTPSHRQIAISIRDAWYFMLIADALKDVNTRDEQSGLVIGNSFGISTVMIAELLAAPIDAIDAETSNGSDEGSALTRRVCATLDLDVQITKGFSPQDLDIACRRDAYSFVLIDGEHTNEQIVMDFVGIKDRLTDRCVVFLHDVGLRDMDTGWTEVQEIASSMGLRGFDLSATDSGSSLLVRGVPTLERMLEQTCPGLRTHNDVYHAGLQIPMPAMRGASDALSLSDGERVAFFGAGQDLAHYGGFILQNPDAVAGVFDDDPSKVGSERFGQQIRSGDELALSGADAVVLSTHAHAERARDRVRALVPSLIERVYPRIGLGVPVRVAKLPERDTR